MTGNAYDEVPYVGHAHAETHPNRLAALARLAGMDTPPVETARILEIACGDGGNLIPIAYSLPRAQCVGFDLSVTAVARARERLLRLGSTRVEVQVADLATVGDIGRFDFVIAHGLYSWIVPSLRDALLRLIADSLSDSGVAFVSYNVYPGWHVGRTVREMLRFHTGGISDATTRIAQAQALLDFLAVAHDPADPYGALLAAECRRVARHSPGHLYHDDLADVNEPVYFHQFVAHAAGFGLAYLTEADFATTTGAELPEAARLKLDELRGDPVMHGQYLDFVTCRRFRETLLSRAKTPAAEFPVAGRVRALFAASAATAEVDPANLDTDAEVQFVWGKRASLKTDHPLAKAAFVAMRRCWPQAVAFDELLDSACSLLGRPSCAEDAESLEGFLLGAFGLRMVELTAARWRCAAQPGERARASALARIEAETDDVLTTLMHRRARVDEPLALRLLRLCDGTRDPQALRAALSALGDAVDDAALQQRLAAFARLGLLEA